MAWRLAKSLETLRNQVNQAYPNRNKASDGTIGDAAHAKVKSEHNPNSAGVVTAMDITHDPKNGADMDVLKEALIKDARTWYVIFNSKIWEAGYGWYDYSGKNPHDKHLHISTKQDAKNYDNETKWNIGGEMPITIKQVDHVLKMGLRKEPTAQELNNEVYQQNPGLLIDTVWNNGGEQSYKDRSVKDQVIARKDAEIKQLQAKLAVQSEDTELLNGFGLWLTKLIARLGLKK